MSISPEHNQLSRIYLFITVFIAGMCTLAVEFTTSRMIQSVYGTSNIVWANVIGLVLLSLTLGYFIGGRLADRRPYPALFYLLVSLAGFCSAFFLLFASAILRQAASALAAVNATAVVGSLFGVIIALVVPVTLLGCISPFAIRLAVRDLGEAGRVSGLIYGVSTIGSLLGTYLPVLWVIPEAGSRWAALIFGASLLLIGIGGLLLTAYRLPLTVYRLPIILLPFLLIPTALFFMRGSIKTAPDQVFETESAYNYIQVIRQDDCNYLLLNEGQAYHSFYCDGGRVPRISVWSMMLAAPYFNAGPVAVERAAVVGLAAGTIPKQITRVFGPIPIDGIELDPQIVAAGRTYFDLNEPNLNVIIGDGRYELNRLAGPYDLITLDAYKVPYIPWHLTTREFLIEVQARLTAGGVVAVNVGRAPEDRRLIEAMTATLLTVFPTVHTIDVPGALNTILVATARPTTAGNLVANLASLDAAVDPLLRQALETAQANLVPTQASNIVFTDDRAPVETITDSLVIRYLLEGGIEALPEPGG
jgi:spermidine synthase